MKKIGLTLCLLTIFTFISNAQESKKKEDVKIKIEESEDQKKKIGIRIKDGEARPMILIDGKEYDFELLELIDKDKIESVTVLKGAEALKAYDAENGVIIIQTKVVDDKEKIDVQLGQRIRIKASGPEGEDEPLIIVDGEVRDRETLDSLSPDNIESIKVYKNEEAIKKYGSETGVIFIVTKKKKEQKN